MFRYLILGLLRGGARMHGYALVKEYRARSGAAVGSGTFYRELQRLLRDGLIRSTANPCEIDARRMPYEITHDGTMAFDDWFSAQHSSVETFSEDELSSRALFIGDAEPSMVEGLLTRLKDTLWLWSKRLEHDWRRLRSEGGMAAHAQRSALPLLIERRQKYVAADIDFVEALRALHEARSAERRPETRPDAAARRRKPAGRYAEPVPASGSRTNRAPQ